MAAVDVNPWLGALGAISPIIAAAIPEIGRWWRSRRKKDNGDGRRPRDHADDES